MLSACRVLLCVFLFFFFSSRRRHTRSLCDWSSDVCSSDLRQGVNEIYVAHVKVAGQALVDALAPMVETALKALPISKIMRWGSGDAQFVQIGRASCRERV